MVLALAQMIAAPLAAYLFKDALSLSWELFFAIWLALYVAAPIVDHS